MNKDWQTHLSPAKTKSLQLKHKGYIKRNEEFLQQKIILIKSEKKRIMSNVSPMQTIHSQSHNMKPCACDFNNFLFISDSLSHGLCVLLLLVFPFYFFSCSTPFIFLRQCLNCVFLLLVCISS